MSQAARLAEVEERDPAVGGNGYRRLVPSSGPGSSAGLRGGDPKVRILRVAVPVLAAAGVLAIALVFLAGLGPGDEDLVEIVGPESPVRAAASERPRRVCLDGEGPCAWLSMADGELVALSTAAPLRGERGRADVGWCPSSGRYGSNSSGARFDALGRVVSGPALRGLDRHPVHVEDGQVVIDFGERRLGVQANQTDEVTPATGAPCERMPFDHPWHLRR